MIDLTELKKLVEYDPLTGVFYWRDNRGGILKGTEAGSLHGTGYIYIRINKVAYLAHRLAWFYVTGEWPKFQIDHKNRVRSDNRFENLGDLSGSLNCLNRKPRKGSRSGVTGVSWKSRDGKWMVYVERNKIRVNLGSYSDLEKAKQVRADYLRSVKGA
jgi:hypothetical protein